MKSGGGGNEKHSQVKRNQKEFYTSHKPFFQKKKIHSSNFSHFICIFVDCTISCSVKLYFSLSQPQIYALLMCDKIFNIMLSYTKSVYFSQCMFGEGYPQLYVFLCVWITLFVKILYRADNVLSLLVMTMTAASMTIVLTTCQTFTLSLRRLLPPHLSHSARTIHSLIYFFVQNKHKLQSSPIEHDLALSIVKNT